MVERLRVLSFESRKGSEMSSLIERHGGTGTVAAAMKEVPLGMTPEIQAFVDGLRATAFDLVVFMTGVGAEALATAIETDGPREEFLNLLREQRIVVRGPKPAAVFKKWGVPFAGRADEPNTWREVLTLVLRLAGKDSAHPLAGLTIAVQEYGAPSSEFYAELEARGAVVKTVSVYQWAFPDDVGPLRAAIADTIAGAFDLILFTTAQHLTHVTQEAERLGVKDKWLAAARRCVIASIGPTASERLREFDLPVDVEPEHPHMGHLVREALERAPSLLTKCRERGA